MNTRRVFCIGPHQYRLFLQNDRWYVEYNLYGTNGVTEEPRPGVPNAWGWKRSLVSFSNTVEGYATAEQWVNHLLRPQDERND